MAALSPVREQVPFLKGLTLLHRGKVRDTYVLSDDLLLVYATDAISIFNFVLDALVPWKGMVLTAMNHFWLKRLEEELGIKTHLVAAGCNIDEYLPRQLRRRLDLQASSLVVKRLTMVPVEFIARNYLTGSGFKDYQQAGMVCGHVLPEGIHDGDALPEAIDTPTDKSEEDMPLDAVLVRQKYPREVELLFKVYSHLLLQTARPAVGLIIADTKLEFGWDKEDNVILADEVGTPDSSRFWDAATWKKMREEHRYMAPPSYDKQVAREWGKTVAINKLKLTPENTKLVHNIAVPNTLIYTMSVNYRELFSRVVGIDLITYQRTELGVNLLD